MKNMLKDNEYYNYYKEDMNKGTVPSIMGSSAVEEKVLLGKILTWLPRKIISLFSSKRRGSK